MTEATGPRPRRPLGTGSLWQNKRGFWTAGITLKDGRQIYRRRWSREEAEQTIIELKIEFADQLGYFYQGLPRPWRFGEYESRLRNPISKRLRFAIFDRDGFRCRYCGSREDLVIDHVLPVVDGGTDAEDNLVTACWDCNAGKGDRPLRSPLPALAR